MASWQFLNFSCSREIHNISLDKTVIAVSHDAGADKAESKNMLVYELANIVGITVLNAYLFEIDLQQAPEETWFSRIKHADGQ